MKYLWRILGLVLLPLIPFLTALLQITGFLYMLKRSIERREGWEGFWAIVGMQWYCLDQSGNGMHRGNPDRTISHRVAVSTRDRGRANRFMYYLHRALERIHPAGHAEFRAIEYDD